MRRRSNLARGFLASAVLLTTLSGCGAILSPYKSELSCPMKDGYGQCLDLETTYKRSLRENSSGSLAGSGRSTETDPEIVSIREKLSKGKKPTEQDVRKLGEYIEYQRQRADNSQLNMFQKEKMGLTSALLKRPNVPIRTPDKVLRVLILPYVDEKGALYEHRYTYVTVSTGEWILGEYLYPKDKDLYREGSTFNPLAPPKEGDHEMKGTEKPEVKPAPGKTSSLAPNETCPTCPKDGIPTVPPPRGQTTSTSNPMAPWQKQPGKAQSKTGVAPVPGGGITSGSAPLPAGVPVPPTGSPRSTQMPQKPSPGGGELDVD